ncbi:MAG: toxin-antitoxin system HicB family antitoxin [Comamonas sp.]|nr:toxin-antitoxin system HicB family antitoxin [Comamonas sp.]
MTTISIRLPNSLHQMAKEAAAQDGVSMNQLIACAIAEKVAALTTETYLQARSQRGDINKFQAALSAVPDVEPPAFDRMD